MLLIMIAVAWIYYIAVEVRRLSGQDRYGMLLLTWRRPLPLTPTLGQTALPACPATIGSLPASRIARGGASVKTLQGREEGRADN